MEKTVQTTDLESRFETGSGVHRLIEDVWLHKTTYHVRACSGSEPSVTIMPCDGNGLGLGEIIQLDVFASRFDGIRRVIYDVTDNETIYHVFEGREPCATIMPFGENEVWMVGFNGDDPPFEERPFRQTS